MSILTDEEYDQIQNEFHGRNDAAGGGWPLGKPEQRAVIQAIEDIFEGPGRAAISSAIDTAAGQTIPGPMKKRLVIAWLLTKFHREIG